MTLFRLLLVQPKDCGANAVAFLSPFLGQCVSRELHGYQRASFGSRSGSRSNRCRFPKITHCFRITAGSAGSTGPQCEDCGCKLTAQNQSALPAYCKKCFLAEAASSAAGGGKGGAACVLCTKVLSADVKSPVPNVCFDCYNDQSKIEDMLPALQNPPTASESSSGSAQPPSLTEEELVAQDKEDDNVLGQFVTLPDGYSLEALVADFESISGSPEKVAQHDQLRWIMYVRVALMLQRGDFRSCLDAETKCAKLRLNRNKLSKVRNMLKHGPLPCECPGDFRMGQNPSLTLTEQEKLDLLNMIRFHARCSLSLTVPQVTRTIVALRMHKAGLFADSPDIEIMQERLTAHFHHYDTAVLWQNFKDWTRTTQKKEDWVSVKSMKQKQVADISGLTPDVVVKTLKELEDTLLEMGIAETVGGSVKIKAEEAFRVATTDEKGLCTGRF